MQMVQEIGNRRARCIYEAGLPENFRRPQTDSYPCAVYSLAQLLLLNILGRHEVDSYQLSLKFELNFVYVLDPYWQQISFMLYSPIQPYYQLK